MPPAHRGIAKWLRHGTLTPTSEGSNPSAPAKYGAGTQVERGRVLNPLDEGSTPSLLPSIVD